MHPLDTYIVNEITIIIALLYNKNFFTLKIPIVVNTPPFRGLNGGYRGLIGIYVFHIFQVKVTLKGHHEPLKIAK